VCVGVILPCGQTIVRRLRQADTHDGLLNPFIEKRADGSIVGHSPSSSTGGSASPKPSVLAGDVVIAGPGPTAEEQEPQRPEFVSALQHALGLREEDLAVLRSTEPSSASPFVSSTLCAVSWVAARGVCVCACLVAVSVWSARLGVSVFQDVWNHSGCRCWGWGWLRSWCM
jgi:hypothetical protein